MQTLRDLFNRTCLAAGIPAIRTDTAARMMAVLLVHGNNEDFVYNTGFRSDVDYIRERFQIHGAGTPPPDFCELVQKYAKELEEYVRRHEDEHPPIPDWALELFQTRYGIRLK